MYVCVFVACVMSDCCGYVLFVLAVCLLMVSLLNVHCLFVDCLLVAIVCLLFVGCSFALRLLFVRCPVVARYRVFAGRLMSVCCSLLCMCW